MKRTGNLMKWFVFVFIAALTLSACVRPVPGSDNTAPDTNTPAETPVIVIPTTPPEVTQPESYPAPGDTTTGGEGATDTGGNTAGDTGGETVTPTVEATPVVDTTQPETPAEPTPETGTTGDTTTPTGERIHIVQAGENLFRIGLQYGFTYQELAAYNGILDPNAIEVGQEIRIPPSQ